jgi:glyoxylase-like metal-dependent hydrolase (beta-lactamase superfamily II)
LDAVTTRVRAANPSPMTLSGTNTYVIGAPEGHDVLVVDPGPATAAHRRAIERVASDRGGRIGAVVVTHHHHDHAEAVGWAREWRVGAYAFAPERIAGTERLGNGVTVPLNGLTVIAHHQPGHTADHVCLQVPRNGVVLTGDHVLGEGTTVIAWPDGDLGQYLDSLRTLRDLHPTALYPGHGEVVGDARRHIDALLAHRAQRTDQILAALAEGRETVADIVMRVYPDLTATLRPAAARSVNAHLADLARRGAVECSDGCWRGT